MKMNKIVAAIIASSVVPGAAFAAKTDNTAYGDFRWSVNQIDTGGTTGSTLSTNNNASRLGFKGSVSEGDIKAIYHFQMGARNDNSGEALTSRFYFAGLAGGFGKVIYGRHSPAYKMAGLRVDPFYDTSAGTGTGGSNYGLSSLTNGFTNNSIAYTSPKIGGNITVNAAAYIDDGANDDHDTNIGVEFKNKQITAGVQLISVGEPTTGVIAGASGIDGATRLYGSFKADAFSAGLSYETLENPGAGDDATLTYLSGSFNIDKDSKVSLALGSVSDGNTSGGGRESNGDGMTLGYFNNILSKTQVYVLFSSVDFDDNSERETVSVGVSHKFSGKL